jgi:hypothetical protein
MQQWLIIWDGLKAHRSKQVRKCLASTGGATQNQRSRHRTRRT